VTRNIVGCPVGGVDPDEICDASPLVRECHNLLTANRDVYNLPRKWKICITGCKVWCPYPEINDIGMTAAVGRVNGKNEIGFNVRVGGGLSTVPHFARKLNAFVRWNEVPLVVKTITEIFRDADVLRENRERARMKFLFTHFGWAEERFEKELEKRLDFRLLPAAPEEIPTDTFRDHVGVYPQKQSGYFYVGMSILAGRITGDQMLAVADLAERYGDGTIRTTNTQNMALLNVPERNVDTLTRELNNVGLPTAASPFRRGAIACTGKQFCKLSLTETKNVTMEIVEHLQTAIPEFDPNIKIHVTGCPNSCGQHWIADIGLQGGMAKLNGKPVEAYDFYVGGGTGKDATFTRRLKYKAPITEVKFAVERLCRAYLAQRESDESFHAFIKRHSDEELVAFLQGDAAKEELVPIPAEVVNPLHGKRVELPE
jgi:sulfite reductase (ferredoxin)